VGIGSLAVQGAKSATMTAKEATLWFVESRVGMAGGVATMAIPAPTAPKTDFRFFMRHGSDATVYKRAQQIKQQADQDIQRLSQRINEAGQQLAMPFFNARV
jgi:hypothetical protein